MLVTLFVLFSFMAVGVICTMHLLTEKGLQRVSFGFALLAIATAVLDILPHLVPNFANMVDHDTIAASSFAGHMILLIFLALITLISVFCLALFGLIFSSAMGFLYHGALAPYLSENSLRFLRKASFWLVEDTSVGPLQGGGVMAFHFFHLAAWVLVSAGVVSFFGMSGVVIMLGLVVTLLFVGGGANSAAAHLRVAVQQRGAAK